MIVEILANMAILLIGNYLYLIKHSSRVISTLMSFWKNMLQDSLLLSIQGVLLINYAVVFSGGRYDFRFLLLVMIVEYYDFRVGLIGTLLFSIIRFAWGGTAHAWFILFYCLVTLFLLYFVKKNIKNRLTKLIEILLLDFISFALFVALSVLAFGMPKPLLSIYMSLFFANLIMILVLFKFVQDVRQAQEVANIDFLTHLYNRRTLYSNANQLFTEKVNYWFTMMDIDFFKTYNDRFGHEIGDQILEEVARTLTSYESSKIYFYRLGGDEFAGIIVSDEFNYAYNKLEEVRVAVSKVPVDGKLNSECIEHVTASLGMVFVDKSLNFKEALMLADKALYEAKELGRNHIFVKESKTKI
ncbi:GGDEF domain-containing protein [Lactovum miscens]|uniref:Diguanylate cyclase (GGDEF)-like protein n=1 Tax=Lactovum miscens TaxID=190387 RepID=A0A841C4W2_9LACT|nr:GGDEF domain-containing protein [Lactovum miscens]MBB5887307.1 diguanylate cyclase (GGDEF)-like protein [Lactovum miscens]